jgi:hypothetical protein
VSATRSDPIDGVSFYDVVSHSSVTVPRDAIVKFEYTRSRADGRLQTRYGLRGTHNSRLLSKFVGRADWESWEFPPEAGMGEVPLAPTPDALAVLTQGIADFRRGITPVAANLVVTTDVARALKAIRLGQLELDLMDSHLFEHLVAELIDRMGFSEVVVTPRSGDDGVDVFAALIDPSGQRMTYAASCKRHRKDRAVKREMADELLGVITRKRLDRGLLVTSSFFSPAAIKVADESSRLRLVNGEQVRLWIDNYR